MTRRPDGLEEPTTRVFGPVGAPRVPRGRGDRFNPRGNRMRRWNLGAACIGWAAVTPRSPRRSVEGGAKSRVSWNASMAMDEECGSSRLRDTRRGFTGDRLEPIGSTVVSASASPGGFGRRGYERLGSLE